MTIITYFFGKTVDERQKLLFEKMSSAKESSMLHLVSTRGRVIEQETDSAFWLRKRSDTLTGLINRIFEDNVRYENYRNCIPIDSSLKDLLIKKILENRAENPEKLLYFNSLISNLSQKEDFPGIYRSIAGFFSHLIKNNYEDVFAHDLAARIEAQELKMPGSGEQKYAMESDLIWLLGDFEELKREMNGYDEDDVVTGVRDFLRSGRKPEYIKNADILILDGFDCFSGIEEEILFYLIQEIDELWWLIDFEGRGENPVEEFKELTGMLLGSVPRSYGKTGNEAYRACYSIASLMKRLEKAGIKHFINRGSDECYMDTPDRGNTSKYNAQEIPFSGLRIGAFPGEIDEIRAIASEIKRIIYTQDLNVSSDLGKIRVIFPELNNYSGLISEIFSEYGLPFSLTSGIPLSSHPISDIFMLLLRLPKNRFDIDDIFRLFSSNLIKTDKITESTPHIILDQELNGFLLPEDTPEKAENIFDGWEKDKFPFVFDVYFFDTVARKCGVKHFDINLEVKEGNMFSFVRDYYASRVKRKGDSKEKKEMQFEYYAFIRQCILLKKILSCIESLNDQKDPMRIVEIYSGMLVNLGFPGNLLSVSGQNNELPEGEYRRIVKRDISAYSLLNDLISSSGRELITIKKLFNIKDGNELLHAFYGLFSERLSNSYLLDEDNPNVIRVSQWLETRGRSFDYIFAGGLTADRFPQADKRDFILRNIPDRITRTVENTDQSRYLFSHVLKNYRKRLYLSYPEYRNEKEVQSSQLIMDLKTIIEKSDVKADALKWKEVSCITSPKDLLNAGRIKADIPTEKPKGLFNLRNVIVKEKKNEEFVIRGVRAIACRWAMDGLFEYDGIISEASKFSNFIRDNKNIFSASQMDRLANCPMRYLFARVYGLADLDEIGPDASPLVAGNFAHNVLSVLFEKFKNRCTNVSETGLAAAFSMAYKAVEECLANDSELERYEFSDYLKKTFLEGLNREIIAGEIDSSEKEGILASLLRFEEKMMAERIPEGIEQGFGFDENKTVFMGKMHLRGIIDRFDRDKNDPDRIYLYDYKTGTGSSSGNIKKGLSFQLPVYIRALSSGNDRLRISASWYSLKRDMIFDNPVHSTVSGHCDGEGLDITGVRLFDEYADQLYSLLEKGRFHNSAEELQCDYCEFRYACHKDSRRMDYLLKSGSGDDIYSGSKNLEAWGRVDQFRKDWKKVKVNMEKAFSLKTESGRINNFDCVMDFKNEIERSRTSLPFDDTYINELFNELEVFERCYLKK